MSTSTIAVDLAGNFEPGTAILAGLIGAVAMLVVIYGGKAMGMTRMDLLKTLGTMAVPKAASNVAYAVGAMMHLMMGAVFGLVHAGLLHAVDPTSDGAAAGFGALFGGVHGMIVRSGDMPAPGVAMTKLGKMTPMGIVMAHVAFGLVTGAIYVAIAG